MKAIGTLSLSWSFVAVHRLRSALTVLTVLATTAAVVWVVAGYEGLLASYDVYSSRALGRYALSVDAISRQADREVPRAVLAELRADARVAAADAMWAERVMVDTGRPLYSGFREVLLLATDAAEPPFELVAGDWVAGASEPDEPLRVCASTAVAERLRLRVGDRFAIGRDERQVPLVVVGLVDNPPKPITGSGVGTMTLPGPGVAGCYVSLADAQRLHRRPPRITFVGIELRDDVDVHTFRQQWTPQLARRSQPLQFQVDVDLEEELDEAGTARNVALQSYGTTALAMLLAFLVVFNTLNMGVSERIRTFAMLRAVALTRGQVVRVVYAEALLLAGLGFVLGVGVGWLAVESVELSIPRLFRHGAAVGALGVALAAVSSLGAALLAAAVPAVRASRVRPLDALAPPTDARPIGLPKLATLIGAAAVVVAVLMSFAFRLPFGQHVIVSLLVVYLLLGVGFVLLAPAVLLLVERLAGPALARLFAVDRLLLQDQQASRLWRNVGATLGLSLGFGLLVAVHAWGFTMLQTFVPGAWAPDAVLVLGAATDDRELQTLARQPAIGDGGVVPFVVEQPRLRHDLTGSAERASIVRQDNVILVGVEPARAFGGERPLLACEWLRGDAAAAVAGMQAGRGCVVPEHFLRETGLDVGDTFEVVPPENPQEPCSYRIAGAVRLSGWHWQTKMTGMRMRTHRAAALVFADLASVRADFDLPRASHAWLDLADDADPAALAAVGDAATALAPTAGDDAGAVDPARVVTVDAVRGSILTQARRYLWAISALPLLVLAIASLGLLNLLVASVRARRWETGVLRAVGFTRGTLLRMVMMEAVTIGVAAAALSIVGGLVTGWCGTSAASRMSFFGGMDPRLTVPWSAIVIGSVLTMSFTLAAAILPARSLTRTPVLQLLQQGRSAT